MLAKELVESLLEHLRVVSEVSTKIAERAASEIATKMDEPVSEVATTKNQEQQLRLPQKQKTQ